MKTWSPGNCPYRCLPDYGGFSCSVKHDDFAITVAVVEDESPVAEPIDILIPALTPFESIEQAGTAFQHVIPFTAQKRVIARASGQMVDAVSTVDMIRAATPIDFVVTRAAVKNVVVQTTRQFVVTRAALQIIIAITSKDFVAPSLSIQVIVSGPTFDPGFTRFILITTEDEPPPFPGGSSDAHLR